MRAIDRAAGLRAAPRISTRVPSGPYAHNVIAVTSGKGGVGKTQISANLSISLASLGRRVLVIDADLGLASLDLALGVRPLHNLMHVLDGDCAVAHALYDTRLGVSLLAACPGRYEMANLDVRQRAALFAAIDTVRDDFDDVVVDTGAGIGSNAVAFASRAAHVLLVTTPDPSSLRDAYAMVKVLHRRGGVERIHTVSNQVASDEEGVELHERLDSIARRFLDLDLEILGAVPRDPRVAAAVRTGEPVVVGHPSTAASLAIQRIAGRLARETQANSGPHAEEVC